MPWDRNAGTNPKYRTAEHRAERARLVSQLKCDGYLICTATECLLTSREITNPDGRARDGLHCGHADNGIDYAGPQHNVCNVRDGAVRARAKQNHDARWVL